MRTIAIITNGTLPVPSTKGGAVESLLQTFININEITNDFQLIIFTINDPKALILAKLYKNSIFVFIDSKSIFYRIGQIIRYLTNRLTMNSIKNQFIFEVLKYKKLFDESELIIIENNPRFACHIQKITNKPIGLHLHNDYLNIDNRNSSIQALDSINFVVTVSEYLKKRVAEISTKNIYIECVYNGIDLSRFMNDELLNNKQLARDKYGISNNELVILFAGRLQESKGIMLLMEAFIEISEQYDAKLLIIGSSGFEGSIKNKFIRHLENLSRTANDKIIFTGYVDYTDIHQIYNIADFAVLPSLASEAFSLTAIESLAAGLPVIISDSGGMPETINEKCGIVINRNPHMKEDLKREMEKLILDTDLRNKMSKDAKLYVQKFNDKTYYQSLSNVYKSFLQ